METERGIIDPLVSKRPEKIQNEKIQQEMTHFQKNAKFSKKKHNFQDYPHFQKNGDNLQLEVGTRRAPTLLVAGPTYRAERPKGVKDEVKRPKGPPARSRDPEGPYTSSW